MEPGYHIFLAGDDMAERAIRGLYDQVKAAEKDFDIDFISNASCKMEESKVRVQYLAMQTVILKPKAEVPKTEKISTAAKAPAAKK
jgi:hypothetical protein